MKKRKFVHIKRDKFNTFLRSNGLKYELQVGYLLMQNIKNRTRGYSKGDSWDQVSNIPEQLFEEDV